MTDYPKTIIDGCVAVLVSPGYGLGWSHENKDHPELLFDPAIVAIVQTHPRDLIEKAVEEYLKAKYGERILDGTHDSGDYIATHGVKNLQVEWVPVGTRFSVIEYDGHEYILTQDELEYVA